MVGELGWYHSTKQILDMAPGFLEVAKESYRHARSEQRVPAFEKWLGSVWALAGIVEEVRKVPQETRQLLESHLEECLEEMNQMEARGLSDSAFEEADQLRKLLERTRRRRGQVEAWSHALGSGPVRLVGAVSGAILQVVRWFVGLFLK